ncbi:MAG: hypothetical protein ABSB41_15085 [Anaerolineales bacterium]|jgi:hypothetical protein
MSKITKESRAEVDFVILTRRQYSCKFKGLHPFLVKMPMLEWFDIGAF